MKWWNSVNAQYCNIKISIAHFVCESNKKKLHINSNNKNNTNNNNRTNIEHCKWFSTYFRAYKLSQIKQFLHWLSTANGIERRLMRMHGIINHWSLAQFLALTYTHARTHTNTLFFLQLRESIPSRDRHAMLSQLRSSSITRANK